MSDSQKIKVGCFLVVFQLYLLGLSMGFCSLLDTQAERTGISDIIKEAQR